MAVSDIVIKGAREHNLKDISLEIPRDQLVVQANGLTGHLDEFWPSLAQSAWDGGDGESWERGAVVLAWDSVLHGAAAAQPADAPGGGRLHHHRHPLRPLQQAHHRRGRDPVGIVIAVDEYLLAVTNGFENARHDPFYPGEHERVVQLGKRGAEEGPGLISVFNSAIYKDACGGGGNIQLTAE